MAIFRTVQMSFWTDADVLDDFTPEDKYFYLYTMTNPHTNLAGCYEISIKNMVMETGYSSDTVKKLIARLEKEHRKIVYNTATKEMLLVNWSKFNWNSSPKFRKPLLLEINSVKCREFREFLEALYNGNDTVSIPYQYGSDTTVTVSVTDTVTDTVTVTDTDKGDCKGDEYEDDIRDILSYLNDRTGRHFHYSTKATQNIIRARLKDNYTPDDFRTVIDNKVAEWGSDKKMCKYLRPSTLFTDQHFEEYLNQGSIPVENQQMQEMIDWEAQFRI